MRHEKRQDIPADVRAVQVRFKRWRRERKGRGSIPSKLWRAAVRLCRRHSVNRVARWLRLNHTALQDWVKGADQGKCDGKGSRPVFMELGGGSPATGSEYMVEAGGVRVRLRGVGVAEVMAVARAFREGGAG